MCEDSKVGFWAFLAYVTWNLWFASAMPGFLTEAWVVCLRSIGQRCNPAGMNKAKDGKAYYIRISAPKFWVQ